MAKGSSSELRASSILAVCVSGELEGGVESGGLIVWCEKQWGFRKRNRGKGYLERKEV